MISASPQLAVPHGLTENEPYSRLLHLALSLHGNANLSEVHMTMLTAYFDVSGKPDRADRAYVVAGFGTSVSNWLEFEKPWKRLIKAFNIPELHMTDVVAKKKKGYRHLRAPGAYASLMEAVYAIVEHYSWNSFVRVIDGPDLAAIRASGREPLVGAVPFRWTGRC